jgi:branched-chain amino acid transport system substrate-binding protein
MTRTTRSRLLALLAAFALVLGAAACGDDDTGDTGDDATADTGDADTGEEPADDGGEEPTDDGGEEPTDEGDTDDGGSEEGAWSVDTADCPDDATEPIEGTVKIGSTMPLSGGVAAAAFAPVAAGFEAFVEHANNEGLVEGYELELVIEDDQFDPTKTTPAVEKLLDQDGVHLFAGMIGTANNLAVRDLLNDECYPQLLTNTGAPVWGDVANYPWTTGGLPPYNTETAIYVTNIQEEFPDGATAAVFHVNSEFGQSYADTFEELAPDAGIDIVDTQTIESADSNPPTSQLTSIASSQPDVILAVPLGAQCPTFMTELANAKAANAGWEPRVYITATCASTLVLAVAGEAADELRTVVWAIDSNDPANDEVPEVAEFKENIDAITTAHGEDYATASVGWSNGEIVVEILNQAAQSSDGLTRASIINAARNLDYEAELHRDGISLVLSGEDDPYMIESMQVVEYDAQSTTFTDIGDLVTDYEGQTEVEE